jgi:hypothetical protein
MCASERPFVPCELKRLEGETLISAAQTAIRINPVNRPIVLNRAESAGIDLGDRMLIAILTDRKWHTNGVHLSVSFMDSPSADLRARILGHMNAWAQSANVRFSETNGTGQVRIAFAVDGYWSYLGTDILHRADHEPTMNLQEFTMDMPESEFVRVVRHETGHTLGFAHEHLRLELVQKLIEQRVIEYYAATQGWDEATTRAQVLTPIADDEIETDGPPDEDSIMCYEIPASLTTDDIPIRGGNDINTRDYAFAAACYPKPA